MYSITYHDNYFNPLFQHEVPGGRDFFTEGGDEEILSHMRKEVRERQSTTS
jgi:hypothetical protein